MNNITLPTLLAIILSLFSGLLQAQDGYTYTLIDNGSYSYTISAVPNPSASNFATSVQSYGFTIILPDGVTASITSSLGNGADATFFDGNNIGQSDIDGYLITETLGTPLALPAPSAGTMTPMVTLQLSTPSVGGAISLLANDSALATTITSLQCFMSADMVDDGMAVFPNVIDTVGPGLSGTTSYVFSTLGLDNVALTEVSAYPNPTEGLVTIKGADALKNIEVFNANGQQVFKSELSLESVDLTALPSGVYFAKIEGAFGIKTLKIIKE